MLVKLKQAGVCRKALYEDRTMRNRLLVSVTILGLAMLATGCTTLIKTGVNVVRGPQGNYLAIDKPSTLFDAYSVLEIEKPTTDMGSACPRGFLEVFQSEVTEELLEKPYFARVAGRSNPLSPKKAGGTLVLRASVIDYSGGGIAGRAIGFGAGTFMVARTRLVDKPSGKAICVANVRGTSKSVAHGGENDLALGYARGIARLIKDHHTEIEPVEQE